MRFRLRTRLTLIVVALSILPQVVTGIILGFNTFLRQEAASVALHQEQAAGVAGEIDGFVRQRVAALALFDRVVQLGSMSQAERRSSLEDLLFGEPAFEEVVLVDQAGREDIRLSRSSAFVNTELKDRRGAPEFLVPFLQREPYFGPVLFDESLGEPTGTIAVPIVDRRTGEVWSVLAAVVRFRLVWDLLGSLPLSQGSDVYVTDEDGFIVAHRSPSVVLSRTAFDLPSVDGRGTGLSGRQSIIATHTITLGETSLIVVAEENLRSALSLAINNVLVTVAVISVSLLLAATVVVLSIRQFVQPVESIAVLAQTASRGDLSVRADSSRPDELGDLAGGFNQMTGQLARLIESLNETVATRTAELESSLDSQKRLVSELESRNSDLESLIYTLSHDLKSPLITINGFLGYIEKNVNAGDIPAAKDDLTRVERAARRMQAMINELLDVFRVGRTGNIHDFIPLDDIIRKSVEGVRGQVEKNRLEIRISPEMPLVYGDPGELQRLFANIIDNAAKFSGTQPSPLLEIDVETREDDVIVCFRDNGMGLDPRHTQRVFGLFDKLDSDSEGSGIGLAISQRAAQSHGGRLWVESDGVGRGSRFYVSLPRGIRQEGNSLEERSDS